MKATQSLHNLGQSIWLDNITRELLDSGTRYVGENGESLGMHFFGASSSLKSLQKNIRLHTSACSGGRPGPVAECRIGSRAENTVKARV